MTAQLRLASRENFAATEGCPFYDATGNSCRAALLAYTPEARQIVLHCSSDDHDDCALFLARALRSSNPGGLDRDVAAYCGK